MDWTYISCFLRDRDILIVQNPWLYAMFCNKYKLNIS